MKARIEHEFGLEFATFEIEIEFEFEFELKLELELKFGKRRREREEFDLAQLLRPSTFRNQCTDVQLRN